MKTIEVEKTVKEKWQVCEWDHDEERVWVIRPSRHPVFVDHENRITTDWPDQVKDAVRDVILRNRPLAEDEFLTPHGGRRKMHIAPDGSLRVDDPGDGVGYNVFRGELGECARDNPNPDGWPRALAYFDRHTRREPEPPGCTTGTAMNRRESLKDQFLKMFGAPILRRRVEQEAQEAQIRSICPDSKLAERTTRLARRIGHQVVLYDLMEGLSVEEIPDYSEEARYLAKTSAFRYEDTYHAMRLARGDMKTARQILNLVAATNGSVW